MWRELVTPEFLQEVCHWTNEYAHAHPPAAPRTWSDVDSAEMETFLGCQMYTATLDSPPRLWWNAGSLCFNPRVFNTFSERRYDQLHSMLRWFPPNTRTPEEKVEPLYRLVVSRYSAARPHPSSRMCLDEAMDPWTGGEEEALPMRQFIAAKPHPDGFKYFELNDKDGFLVATKLYGGRGEAREVGLTHNIVMEMMGPYLGQWSGPSLTTV